MSVTAAGAGTARHAAHGLTLHRAWDATGAGSAQERVERGREERALSLGVQ